MSTRRCTPDRVRALVVSVGVAAAGLAGVVAAPAAQAAPTPAAGHRWQVTDHLALDTRSAATSCPTATTCWAVEGGKLLQTADLGATWVDRVGLVPAAVRGLHDIACTASDHCLLTATTDTGSALVVVDGTSALARLIPGAPRDDLRLDCSTPVACLATDGTTAFRTPDAGLSWRQAALPRAVAAPAVSCPTGTATCLVVGSHPRTGTDAAAFRSVDSGSTWADLAIPDGFRNRTQLRDVDCVSATSCRAVGVHVIDGVVLGTVDAGQTWTAATLPAGISDVVSVACTSGVVCRAVGQGDNSDQRGISTTDGALWAGEPLADGYLQDPLGIACGDRLRCVAVTTGLVHRAAGPDARWADVPLPAALSSVIAVSCSDVAACVGIAVDPLGRPVALRGAPGSWTQTAMPAAVGKPVSIDCASRTTCVVLADLYTPARAGYVRNVWRTVDGGRTWASAPVPVPGVGFSVTVSCPTVAACFALELTRVYEPDPLRSVDGGATWTRLTPPSGARFLRTVSCSSATACVALGDDTWGQRVAWRTVDFGTTWAASAVSSGSAGGFDSLSCWAATCVATGTGQDGTAVFARSVDRGRTWTLSAPPSPVDYLSGFACTSQGRCAATGTRYRNSDLPMVSVDGGATWRADSLPAAVRYTGEVGCYSEVCFAVVDDRYGSPLVVADGVPTGSVGV